jgi:predicted RNA-binding Zn-ribbon protein involved in translation (DUF1610 family)
MPAASEVRVRCPSCGADLWTRRKGEWTLANRILKLDEEGRQFVARCPECATNVPLDLARLASILETLPPPAKKQTAPSSRVPGTGTRLVVRVDRSQKT